MGESEKAAGKTLTSMRGENGERGGGGLSLCVSVEAQRSRKVRFQSYAASSQSSNAPRRID